MRLWQNARGDLVTDEQVLGYIASFGNLEQAARAGDIRLVSASDSDEEPVAPRPTESPRLHLRARSLDDYLRGR